MVILCSQRKEGFIGDLLGFSQQAKVGVAVGVVAFGHFSSLSRDLSGDFTRDLAIDMFVDFRIPIIISLSSSELAIRSGPTC
jgi:hypothetical protein